MSNLKDLVPPLELCQKIPPGAFADSVLVYAVTKHSLNYCFGDRRCFINDYRELIPAPTLQEILADMAKGNETLESHSPELNYNRFCGGWILRGRTLHREGENIFPDWIDVRDKNNPVTAAMKLWLDVNGMDRTDKTNKTNKEE